VIQLVGGAGGGFMFLDVFKAQKSSPKAAPFNLKLKL